MLTFNEALHEYRWNGEVRPSVTQVISRLSSFGMVPPDVLAAAQERGTAVHTLTQYNDEDDLDMASVDPAYSLYLSAWIKFCTQHRTDWRGIEYQSYSPRFGYAGTMDRYGHLNGQPYVIDIKTGAQSHKVWGMQTAAYRQLLAENIGHEWMLARRATVQLRHDGAYKLIAWDDPSDWSAFLALITLTNWSNP